MPDKTKAKRWIKRTNPYSGESAYLTYTETKIHDKIKQDEIDEK